MANYKFEDFQVEIKAPTISVHTVNDNFETSTCSVDVLLSLGNPQANAVRFIVNLTGFTYVDEWVKADVEAWILTELVQYEV